MIIWTIKLYKSIKTAIAGRRYPHQLAAAVAFGALLGVVPHGNLLALAILIVVLSLRLNHAMAGITAIGVSFAASRMDPYSHVVGNHILSNPQWNETASQAWQLPVVPWTDLNNSVVMGSFVIGVAALIPIFLVTYPIFRLFMPTESEETKLEEQEIQQQTRNVAKHSVVLVDQGHDKTPAPHIAPGKRQPSTMDADPIETTASSPESSSTHLRFDTAEKSSSIAASMQGETVSVETRVDVIRMTDYQVDTADTSESTSAEPSRSAPTPPPSDEALNYLLRQLRDSQQQRKAA
ncbi:MAG: TIGR03546 family protein [Pirellulaceae bacterium]